MAHGRKWAFSTGLLAGYCGLAAGRHGDLAWHGMDDLWRLGVLAGSAAIGLGVSWLAARLGETRRPETRHAAAVVSLAEARAARRS